MEGSGRRRVDLLFFGSRERNIKEFGAALASVYDHLILTDVDPRSRLSGETPELVRLGALETAFPESNIELVTDPLEAIDLAFAVVQPGDLVMIQGDAVAPMLGRVMDRFRRTIGHHKIGGT
ncbi:glutamate ligase domain-containing protein [Planctomycetota bacterium]